MSNLVKTMENQDNQEKLGKIWRKLEKIKDQIGVENTEN